MAARVARPGSEGQAGQHGSSAFRSDNGALADALPNRGRRVFGEQADSTCPPPSGELDKCMGGLLGLMQAWRCC